MCVILSSFLDLKREMTEEGGKEGRGREGKRGWKEGREGRKGDGGREGKRGWKEGKEEDK